MPGVVEDDAHEPDHGRHDRDQAHEAEDAEEVIAALGEPVPEEEQWDVEEPDLRADQADEMVRQVGVEGLDDHDEGEQRP